MLRQARVQALHLVERNVGAGRVVRVRQKHDFGALGHLGEDRIHVGGEILLGRDDGRRARAERRDRIDQKAVRGVDRLVAVLQVRARKEIEQIVGAGAAHQPIRIEAERSPDRLAQFGRGAIRVILQMPADRVVGFDRMRTCAERRLVRRELEDFRDAGRVALARHVGLDVEHAGTRLRTL